MGIKQLLPFVKKACREGSILEFKECSVAVDVSCLLHKGLFGCMEQFANGNDTKFYIHYVKKHINALLGMNCHVIMVFDGRPLPAKKDTNDERRQKRAENMMAGQILLSQGKKGEAVSKFQQAITLTPEVVENTIEYFKTWENVDTIVAPYESDAQLAFLTKEGFADVVVTEDSDLIAFGCEKIVFKWNADSGECTIYEKVHLPSCFQGEMRANFDFTKFRRMCILSGCDYLQNGLPGIGLNKAVKFFTKTAMADLRTVLPRIPSYLQDSKLKISPTFIDEFIRAENTFLHQRCQRPLNPYPVLQQKNNNFDDDEDFVLSPKKAENGIDYSYAGVVCSSSISVRLALGNQANNGQINDKFLLPTAIPKWSIWSDIFESGGQKQQKREKVEAKKQKSCGAFQLDSPKKRKRRSDESIHIDNSLEEGKENIKCPPAKKSAGRPKKIRNEPKLDESYEEIMRKYCPEKFEPKSDISVHESVSVEITTSITSNSIVEQQSETTIEIKSDLTCTLSSESSPQSQENIMVESNESSAPETKKIQTPVPVKSVSLPVSTGKKALGTGKSILGKSPYFSGKSPNVSNPFKKVAIGVEYAASPVQSPKVEESPKSLLSNVEDGGDGSTPTSSRLINRFVGFKAPGLRRSITK